MSEERRRILDMLAEGKISAGEAEQLLDAIRPSSGTTEPGENGERLTPAPTSRPKYLRVVVEEQGKEGSGKTAHVNVRVPLQLLRSGIKLQSLIPQEAQTKVNEALREKGIDLGISGTTPETLDQLIESLSELTVDVYEEDDSSGETTKVRMFCES